MAWLRRAVTNVHQNVPLLRDALMATAQTVQYEAAGELGKQLGVDDLPPEPFTARQQRQSRMDGGAEEDESRRDYVAVAPPVEQPHIERERCLAAAQNRLSFVGSAAYRNVPLTGAFQAKFPAYCQRSSYGCLDDQLPAASSSGASQPAASLQTRTDLDLFTLAPDGQVLSALNTDGTATSEQELQEDARLWARSFALDVFNLHCVNHEHDCTETCVKYMKNKLEGKDSLRSSKVPSCRF